MLRRSFLLLLLASSASAQVVDFEDQGLGANSFANGSGNLVPPATVSAVPFVSRGATLLAETLSPLRYLEAVGEIHAFGRQMAAAFADFDILLSATLSEPPAKVGRFSHETEDYLAYRIGPKGIFAYSPFCAIFNASGQPAASVPLGMSKDGLPIGVHLAAPYGNDEELIAMCAELEAAQPWAARRPAVSS
jgi:amidase/6-aminohexanoate-cyclic-dimer hydrolase